jgi:hypothetical protein
MNLSPFVYIPDTERVGVLENVSSQLVYGPILKFREIFQPLLSLRIQVLELD